MVFSSVIFLFAFLPVCLFFYYIIFRKSAYGKNVFLLIASLVFYAWGEPIHILLMIASILLNWYCAMMLEGNREKSVPKKAWLTVGIIVNTGILFFFKYSAFFVKNANVLLGTKFNIPTVVLPIGISFFTFQAMSYIIDVYRGSGRAQNNPLNVGLYISLFPQLIAGPIVRYETIEWQLFNRTESISLFSEGIERFVIGLAKKTLLANSLAIIADNAFNNVGVITSSMAWLGIFSYTLQIYNEFSGNSDMAIGLGKMFGFQFEENFKYPYISGSISEFWRRWHISMGTWFRDYIYFPLGGSRVTKMRMIFNLFVVWILTGLWHGADWSFVLWGLFFFVLIVIEKLTKVERHQSALPIKIFRHFITFFLIMIGWVLFRANDIPSAAAYFGKMFRTTSASNRETLFFLRNNAYVLLAATIFAFPIKEKLGKTLSKNPTIKEMVKITMIIVLFCLSVIYAAKNAYSPFIYFNF